VGGRGVKLTIHFHLVLRLRMVELYPNLPVRLHGVVLHCITKYRDNFTFLYISLTSGSGSRWLEGLVGPRAGLDIIKIKILPLPEFEPPPFSPSLYRLSFIYFIEEDVTALKCFLPDSVSLIRSVVPVIECSPWNVDP
jgi:hypothetical protein